MKRLLVNFLRRWKLDPFGYHLRHLGRRARRLLVSHDQRLVRNYFAQPGLKKLHLGCGDYLLQGWLNTDYEPVTPNVCFLDVTRSFPFATDSFAYVYHEHLIEHLPLAGGIHLLQECFRVLQPGGVMRVTTPDVQFLLNLMQAEKSAQQLAYLSWETDTYVRWAPRAEDIFVFNNFVRDWGHQFIYDVKTLVRLLGEAGFREVKQVALEESHWPELQKLENVGRMPAGFLALESFALEAVK